MKKNMSYYIKKGVPAGYMVRLKAGRLRDFINGLLKKPFINQCGRNFKAGKKVRLLYGKHMYFGNSVSIGDYCVIDALSVHEGGVVLQDNTSIGEYSAIKCTGDLNHLGKGIRIKSNTHFGEYCFFGAAGGIEIGRNVLAGQNIRFHSENHNFSDTNKLIKEQGVTHQGIVVGDDCWIGSGAVFLDGACVGDGCVIAANAVVTGKFDSGSVIGGIPAKVLRHR